MLIDIITQDTPQALLSLIARSQQGNGLVSALHVRFGNLELKPDESGLVPIIRSILEEKQAAIYFFDDGDVIITWGGAQKAVLQALIATLEKTFTPANRRDFCTYYDMQAHGQDLRLLCMQKTGPLPVKEKQTVTIVPPPAAVSPSAPVAMPTPDLAITEKTRAAFQFAVQARKTRLRPEILLVEDQLFSRKLLATMLENKFKTYEAEDAKVGLDIYLQCAPDIVFLDIEMPGANGHQFAALVHALDPKAYIVMVTGNSQLDDVKRAKENSAKGFVVKPFSREKIHDHIQKFLRERR